MHCGLVCLLASVLAVGVFAGAAPINKRAVAKLRLLCSIEQNRILDEIVENRSRLALEGLLLGLVAAVPFGMQLKSWCSATVVLFCVQSAYYHAVPKTKWMLAYLETREQVHQWLEVYRYMQLSGITTSLLAAIVYLSLTLIMQPRASVLAGKAAK